MHRFFVPSAALRTETIVLPEEIRRHMGVLRLAAGAEILLLDGSGLLCRCRVEHMDRNSATALVLERHREEETAFFIELLQALPKGDKMDLVLQKGTELGISRFVPLHTARSIPRLPVRREQQRRQRWQRIVQEAARQCRRPQLPAVTDITHLAEALAACRAPLRLMLWEKGSRPLEQVLPGRPPAGAALLIGPEGGFSDQEADLAQRHGFIPISFGPRILRSETAGFAAATVLQYRYGDLGGNRPHRTGQCPLPEENA
jgi:16S rRNA (uracil1498-N3)-methyltransferase